MSTYLSDDNIPIENEYIYIYIYIIIVVFNIIIFHFVVIEYFPLRKFRRSSDVTNTTRICKARRRIEF